MKLRCWKLSSLCMDKGDLQMGKTTGFLEYKREEEKLVPVKERIKNFKEFHTSLDVEDRRKQGARCMDCGVPFCQSGMKLSGMFTGCPLHNLIPEWNDQIYQGHFQHALSRLLKTSNFPEFTGRVCPALCEKACINGMDGEPVTIHNNELFLVETGFQNGWIKPRIPEVRSGKHVAVVGSGPSGLAVADQLNHRGHNVTVFERDDRIGGLLMYGIPNMKLEKQVISRRRNLMEEEGVVFKTGVDVGKDISADELLKEYDAVILACGAKKARALAVKDFDKIGGIYFAVDFLKSNTKSILDKRARYEEQAERNGNTKADSHGNNRSLLISDPYRPQEGSYISARDKHVVIVGGGDTGNDCLGTCIRHGAASVVQLEMMPEPPETRLPSNPWPEWPRVKKTDYGQQEAISEFGHDPRIYETTVKELHADQSGNLSEIVTVKVKFENRKMVEVEGSEKTLKCELLLVAAGFVGCQDYVTDAFRLERGPRGTVLTQPEQYHAYEKAKPAPAAKTAKPADSKAQEERAPLKYADKIFTCGDMHRGQSLVVWAIAEGRACAKEVDEYLMGYTNL